MLGRSSELMLTNVAQKNSGMYHCFAEVVGVSYLLWRNNVFDPAFPLTRFVLTMPGTLASAPMLSLVPIISFYLLQFIFRPTINNLVTNKNSLHLGTTGRTVVCIETYAFDSGCGWCRVPRYLLIAVDSKTIGLFCILSTSPFVLSSTR